MIIALVLGIYFVIVVILSIVFIFYTDDMTDYNISMFATAVVWPLAIIVTILLALFEFLFKVCKRIKEKKNER